MVSVAISPARYFKTSATNDVLIEPNPHPLHQNEAHLSFREDGDCPMYTNHPKKNLHSLKMRHVAHA